MRSLGPQSVVEGTLEQQHNVPHGVNQLCNQLLLDQCFNPDNVSVVAIIYIHFIN